MKIQGPNPLLNIYQNQNQKHSDMKKQVDQKDKINISNEAKKLQNNGQLDVEREKYVEEMKRLVQSGEYKVNHENTAQKMIDFWTERA